MRFLYCTYQLFIGYPLFLLSTAITTLSIVVGCAVGDAHKWGYIPCRWWGRSALWLMFIPVKVEGMENLKKGESYVFVANHQGFFDIFLVFAHLNRNIKWMMKWQISHWPLIGIAAVRSKQILVDRRSRASVKKTYEDARQTLQDGTSVVLFPEGARTFTGHMGFFRRGGFMLADELQLPVVPLTINGSFNVMPRNSKSKFVFWHPMKLTIHKPIYPKSQGADNQKRMMEESYQTIMSALPTEYQGYVENPDQ